jgi:hypothetical protein
VGHDSFRHGLKCVAVRARNIERHDALAGFVEHSKRHGVNRASMTARRRRNSKPSNCMIA